MKIIKELTKAEEQIMKVLWRLKKGSIKEVSKEMREPKPAYNTIATVLKVLTTKGFVAYEVDGSTFAYFPLVAERDYRHFAFDKVLSSYFNNSYQSLLSFLAEEKDIDPQAQENLMRLAEKLRGK